MLSHDHSQADAVVAHQTVSHRWDRDLVPDDAGATDRPDPGCPVETALAAIGGRWTTLILRELMHGPLSFSDLGAALPQLSDKVLDERLRRLRSQGLVARRADTGFPRRVSYSLTPSGHELRPLLVELYRTGVRLRQAFSSDESRPVPRYRGIMRS